MIMKKNRQIIKLFTIGTMAFVIGFSNVLAQDTGTGTGWSEPSSTLLLTEKFQGFEFFHSQPDANSGNSRGTVNPELDPEDPNYITPGYKNITVNKKIIGSSSVVGFNMYQCAFAPEWMTAYAYRDETNEPGSGVNTPGVSNGFVEISREYPSHYTIPGYFEVDLGNIPYIEMIQYSHSSAGGNKRGVLVEFSLDNGANWDTLRYQSGNHTTSFTRDMFSLEDTPNAIRCDPSAYGMLWEDRLYFTPDAEYDDHLKIRFSVAGGQVPRIHDLIIYGDLPTSIFNSKLNDLGISYSTNLVTVNELAEISIYSLTGALVKHVVNEKEVSISDLPVGIYVVKAQAGVKMSVTKIRK